MVSGSPGTFIDTKVSYARSRNFLARNTRATGIYHCLINQNSVTKITRVHKNFIPNIPIYTKSRLFTKIFSFKNLEPYGITYNVCVQNSHATVDLILITVDQKDIEHWKEPASHMS